MGLTADLLGRISKGCDCSCFSPSHVLILCFHVTTQITHTNPATVWNHSFPPELSMPQRSTSVVCALPQPIACPVVGPISSASPAQCLTCCYHTTQTQHRETTRVSWRDGEGALLSQWKAAAASVTTVHSWLYALLNKPPLCTGTSVWLHDIECWDNLECSKMTHIRAV